MILFGLAAQVSFTFFLLFAFLLFWFKQPAPPSKAPRKLYVCVFCGEKKNNTKMFVQILFFLVFYAHSLIFSVSGPFGLFPFLVPFWMEHVDSFIFANSSFCALDGCSWRFLHLLDNSLFLFRIIKRVSATMMETFEKPTASFFRFLLSVEWRKRLDCLVWRLIYFQGQTENVNQPNGIEEGALGLFFFFKFY